MASKKRGLLLEVKSDKASEEVLRMLEWNWKRRFEKLQAQVVYRSAETSLKFLREKVPAKAENKEYLQSLSLVGITGLPEGSVGYAIQGKSKKVSTRGLAPGGTLMYVRARRSPKRIPPEVTVLVEHSPWTMNSLPFVPKKSDAVIIYRKVSARAVEKAEKSRKKDKRVWKPALSKKRISAKGFGGRFKLGSDQVKVVPDLAFSALNLEFGQGGVKAKPHWRTAISGLKRRAIPNMTKNRDMARAVSDPSFKSWMAWPKKTSKRISVRVAKTFVPFQKKLGIKTAK